MPRKPRLHIVGGVYHIISRGNNRQIIFQSPQDYKKFFDILERLKGKYKFLLHAYCLMPNHFHLLVEAGKEPISAIMQRMLTSYTKYFNKLYKRKGHLFQGRYKAIICEKDMYLMELIRYIHLNPVRAKMVKSPSEWPWCGHGEYLSGKKSIIDGELMLSYFGQEFNSARRGYVDFVRDGLLMGHKTELYPEENVPYIGGAQFTEMLALKYEDISVKLTPGKTKRTRESLKDIIGKVAQRENIEGALIEGDSRIQSAANARRLFVVEALKEGYKSANIARFLNRTQGYITHVVNGSSVVSHK